MRSRGQRLAASSSGSAGGHDSILKLPSEKTYATETATATDTATANSNTNTNGNGSSNGNSNNQ